MLFCSFSTFQSRNAHIQCLNFDQLDPFSQMTPKVCYRVVFLTGPLNFQLDPFSQMTPKVCYINLKNSENLSRAEALGRRFPCDPIKAKIRRLGMEIKSQ